MMIIIIIIIIIIKYKREVKDNANSSY